jgi:hypothetical protein
MPVVVNGVKQLQKAMSKISPDLNTRMKADIKEAMIPIRNTARGYLPSNTDVLSGWTKLLPDLTEFGSKGYRKYRAFPNYDQSIAQAGIVYRAGLNKANKQGFRAAFYIANTTAGGAIYETAGRKNPNGSDPSESLNPRASIHFIESLGGSNNMRGSDKQKGRALYRAWTEDQGKVTARIVKTIEAVAIRFNKDTQLRKAA